jgi:hypothetical protein
MTKSRVTRTRRGNDEEAERESDMEYEIEYDENILVYSGV